MVSRKPEQESMSSRAAILAAIRRNRPAVDVPLPDPPRPSAAAEATIAEEIERFTAALALYGGKVVVAGPGEPAQDAVTALFPQHPSLCSATSEVAGSVPLPPVGSPQALASVEIGVVRAAFGVADTGSVFLSETELRVNAIGYLVEHLVILLDPAVLLPDLGAAYARAEFATAAYAVLMTGPSATADIEGVLIRGAQGVRALTVVLCPAPI
jgi:L-lactate dehydrogenase complex protein LldG